MYDLVVEELTTVIMPFLEKTASERGVDINQLLDDWRRYFVIDDTDVNTLVRRQTEKIGRLSVEQQPSEQKTAPEPSATPTTCIYIGPRNKRQCTSTAVVGSYCNRHSKTKIAHAPDSPSTAAPPAKPEKKARAKAAPKKSAAPVEPAEVKAERETVTRPAETLSVDEFASLL